MITLVLIGLNIAWLPLGVGVRLGVATQHGCIAIRLRMTVRVRVRVRVRDGVGVGVRSGVRVRVKVRVRVSVTARARPGCTAQPQCGRTTKPSQIRQTCVEVGLN